MEQEEYKANKLNMNDNNILNESPLERIIVWVMTSAEPAEVKSWFEESIAPDECWAGWTDGVSFEPLDVEVGKQPIACWWD